MILFRRKVNFRVLRDSPRKLRTTQSVAAVLAATSRKRVEAAFEFASHLFVGGAASRYEHNVETCEPQDGDEQQGDDAHNCHPGTG